MEALQIDFRRWVLFQPTKDQALKLGFKRPLESRDSARLWSWSNINLRSYRSGIARDSTLKRQELGKRNPAFLHWPRIIFKIQGREELGLIPKAADFRVWQRVNTHNIRIVTLFQDVRPTSSDFASVRSRMESNCKGFLNSQRKAEQIKSLGRVSSNSHIRDFMNVVIKCFAEMSHETMRSLVWGQLRWCFAAELHPPPLF